MLGSNHQKTDATSLLVKLNFLVLGLVVVAYGIYSLRSGVPTWITALTGGADAASITLCETRVTGLVRPNKFKISQEGRRWLREGDSKTELNFLSMERWFGANCKVPANFEAPVSNTAELTPSLFVQFVTNSVEPLFQTKDGVYVWKGQAFRSPKLDSALQELESLSAKPQ